MKGTFPSRRAVSKPGFARVSPLRKHKPAQAMNAHRNVSLGFPGDTFVSRSMWCPRGAGDPPHSGARTRAVRVPPLHRQLRGTQRAHARPLFTLPLGKQHCVYCTENVHNPLEEPVPILWQRRSGAAAAAGTAAASSRRRRRLRGERPPPAGPARTAPAAPPRERSPGALLKG